MTGHDLVHILEEYGLDKEVKIWLPDRPEQEQGGPLEVPVKGVHIEVIDPDEESGQKFIELGHTIYLVPDFDYDLMKTYRGQDPEKNLWMPASGMVRVVTMGRRDVFGGEMPMESFIANSTEGFQKAVNADTFEMLAINFGAAGVFQLVMDEDGKRKQLAPTLVVDGHLVVGPVFFTKTDSSGESVNLSDDDVHFLRTLLASTPLPVKLG